MTPEWREFLNQNGAEFKDGDWPAHFGNDERELRAALGGNVMCDLSQYRLLAIQGSDAIGFLQGQLTSDVRQLTPANSQLTGFCTPKGRLISTFRLLQNGATIFAVIPADVLQTTHTQLQKYVISADVQMGDASDVLIHFGATGEQAETILEDQLGGLPAATGAVLQHDRFMVIKVGAGRYEIFGNFDDCKDLWSQLDVHCTAVGNHCWQFLNIRDGIPDITEATSEAFVPQMVNLDLLGGINYDKGCYTGQEIVARTHYLGKQKRRMYHIHIQCDQAPRSGDELAVEGASAKQYTGTIINVEADAVEGYEALAVIDIKAADKGGLKLKDVESKIELLELPYALQAS